MPSPRWPDLDALPGVADAVQAARAAIASARRMPGNRRNWPTTAAAAAVRAARCSAVLDGGSGVVAGEAPRPGVSPGGDAPGPRGDRIAESASAPGEPVPGVIADPVLAGALRAQKAIGELASVWPRAPLQALARLHALAAADLTDPASLGRPRDAPAVADRLAALAAVVTAAPWSGPVLVAVVHGELLALAPFGTADGVVARAAARLAMVGTGLDPQALTVPEVGYLRAGPEYRAAAAAFAGGSADALAGWIRLVCKALTAGAREATSIATAAGGGLTPELTHRALPGYLDR